MALWISKREAFSLIKDAYNKVGENNAYDADPCKTPLKLELKPASDKMHLPQSYQDVRYDIVLKAILALAMAYYLFS